MRLISVIIVTFSLVLAGCGWQLRGTLTEQKPLPPVTVISDDSYSPMTRSLREAITKQATAVETDAEPEPAYVLRVLEEVIDKRAITYNATGTPAQYEMTLTITYAIQPPNAQDLALPRTVSSHRTFDFDPRNVVAKSEEERALLQHMRQQLAQTLISEVRRVHNSPASAPGDEQ